MTTPPSGLLLVVSSPSGAGKTTLCRRLLSERLERGGVAPSGTSPSPLGGDSDGSRDEA